MQRSVADHAERRAARVEQLTHIGSWEWEVATNTVWWSDEMYRIYGLEPGSSGITLQSFLARVHPEDRQRIAGEVEAALKNRSSFAYRERIVRGDGEVRVLDSAGTVSSGADGEPLLLTGTCRDVTESVRAERLKSAEQEILEAIASEGTLQVILSRIVVLIEEQSPGTLASILLIERDGKRVRHAAAPSLPAAYLEAIDGSLIGPAAGSCGTAAFRKQAVFVDDIESDPLWADYRDVARANGLRACWSTPLMARDGRVLGTFALYYREPRSPNPFELRLIERAGHLTAIAVENRQLQEQLRAVTDRVEAVREEERTTIAREIHDQLGQTLTGLKLDLAWLARHGGSGDAPAVGAAQERIQEMSDETDGLINQVRRISADLRPVVLDDLGLSAAIEWQAQEFERRTGIACAVQSNLEDRSLPRPIATSVFRIFQESLTNITRHAHAEAVDVALEASKGWLRFEVSDDGVGISPDAVRRPDSLGLLGIRERAMRLGGEASFSRGASRGTTLIVRLPLSGIAEAS